MRAGDEDRDAGEQHRAAAVDVGELAVERRDGGRGQQIGGDDPGEDLRRPHRRARWSQARSRRWSGRAPRGTSPASGRAECGARPRGRGARARQRGRSRERSGSKTTKARGSARRSRSSRCDRFARGNQRAAAQHRHARPRYAGMCQPQNTRRSARRRCTTAAEADHQHHAHCLVRSRPGGASVAVSVSGVEPYSGGAALACAWVIVGLGQFVRSPVHSRQPRHRADRGSGGEYEIPPIAGG